MQTAAFQAPATIEQNTAAIAPDPLSAQARQAIGAACVQAWDRFCTAVGASRSMPAAPETVANYLARLAAAGKSVATIRLAASAISTAHRAAEVDNPCTCPVVKMALKGISRQHRPPPSMRPHWMQSAQPPCCPVLAGAASLKRPIMSLCGARLILRCAVCCQTQACSEAKRPPSRGLTWRLQLTAPGVSGSPAQRLTRKGRLWRSRRRRCRRWRRSATAPATTVRFSI